MTHALNIEFLQKYHVWCVVMWSSSKPLQKGHAFQNGILVCLYGSHGFLDGILLEILFNISFLMVYWYTIMKLVNFTWYIKITWHLTTLPYVVASFFYLPDIEE